MAISRRFILASVTFFGLARFASLAAYSQSADIAAFEARIRPYMSLPPLVVQASGTYGRGAAAKEAAATITIDSTGNASLHMVMGAETLDEQFGAINGITTCDVSYKKANSPSPLPEACGFPVPWFFPFSFLPSLDTSRFQLALTDNAAGAVTYTISQIHKAPLGYHVPQTQRSSFVFDPEKHLSHYVYWVPVLSRSTFSNAFSISYADYQSYGSLVLPSHIRQYVDGNLLIDLTISAVSEGH